jgi:hypothetical protein
LFDSWQLTLDHGRPRDLIPYWIIISAMLGALAARYLPPEFWSWERIDAAVGAMSGLLTFNGIVLALCWSAFGKVYEIVGAGAFCTHLSFVRWCHLAQVLAIMFTAFALASLWMPLDLWFKKAAVGAAIGFSIYAVRQGYATSEVMQDLIWRKSEFDETIPAPAVKPVEGAR